MTIGAFVAVLSFAISLILNRMKVDHFWCFAIAVTIPVALVLGLMQSHMSTGQSGVDTWVKLILLAAVAAAFGFLFRKRPS